MRMIAYIALGGILGTLARYVLQGALQIRGGAFPTGTLAINLAGSFLLAFTMRLGTGSTVISPELRGVAGFGASSVMHTDKVLRLSLDLPLIIEIVETEETIQSILPDLDEMIGGGLVTLERARVILYRGDETKAAEGGKGRQ